MMLQMTFIDSLYKGVKADTVWANVPKLWKPRTIKWLEEHSEEKVN